MFKKYVLLIGVIIASFHGNMVFAKPTDTEIICINIERVSDAGIDEPQKLLNTWLFLDDYLVYKDKGNALFAKTWENPDTDMLNLGPQLIPEDKREKFLSAIQKTLSDEQKKSYLYVLYETTKPCSSDKIKALRKRILSDYLPQEKALFKKQAGDKEIGRFMLPYFMISNNRETPQEKTAYIYKEYPTMDMRVVQSIEGGVLVQGKFLSKVEQVYADGELDRPILIKTSRKYVDDSSLAQGYYAYIGLKEYINVLGVNRTVYAFEEIPNLKVNDLLFYKGE